MKRGRLILYIGGIRSGKSEAAEARVRAHAKGGAVAYLATARAPKAGDKALAARIRAHVVRRPAAWETWETWETLLECLKKASKRPYKALYLDGMGMYCSRALARPQAAFLDDIEVFALGCRHQASLTVVVADEVGLGGIAGHPVSRAFADLNGLANQVLARHADEVWVVNAGILSRIK